MEKGQAKVPGRDHGSGAVRNGAPMTDVTYHLPISQPGPSGRMPTMLLAHLLKRWCVLPPSRPETHGHSVFNGHSVSEVYRKWLCCLINFHEQVLTTLD